MGRVAKPSYRVPTIRLSVVRDGSAMTDTRIVRSSADAAAVARAIVGDADREYFVAMLLDAKHRVSAVHVVAIGSLTLAIVHPREVFKAAVIANAAAVVVAHNHPSGDPSPSAEDREMTARLATAGDVLGIKLLDHVIVGDGERYVSFADPGWLSG